MTLTPTGVVSLRRKIAARTFDDYDFQSIKTPETDSAGIPLTGVTDNQMRDLVTSALYIIGSADVPSYLVTMPILDVLLQAAQALPILNVQTDEPSTEGGCVFFEAPYELPKPMWPNDQNRTDWHGFVWWDFGNAISTVQLVRYPETDDADYPVPSAIMPLTRAEQIDETKLGPQAMAARVIVALWRFINQQIFMPGQAEPMPRGIRRDAERRKIPLPEVRVIKLRTVRRPGSGEEVGSDIEWSHRWIVRGHWRQQWHPSTMEHRLKWISPYLKGPEDKPLIIRPTVYDVVR